VEVLRVRWHGHSCFEVADDDLTVVTDPHDGKSLGIAPPRVKADVLLVSHEHFDHASIRTVEKPGSTIIYKEPGEITDGPLWIKGVTTFHDSQEGESRGENIAFVFELGGVRFCHLGDLGHKPTEAQLEEIGPIDVLFAPIGGVFTIDAPAAWRVADMVKPKVLVPMHYRFGGLSLSINDLAPFLEGVDPEIIIRVGNEVEFSEADLEDDMCIWVFTL
jgi:L-ascorbate metabolism protein UlaG (beta-lactamase superfamily)